LTKKNPENKKGFQMKAFKIRSGGIRTRDLFHPKEARYQAALRPVNRNIRVKNQSGVCQTLLTSKNLDKKLRWQNPPSEKLLL
jgi:hypothetical protein